MATANDFDYSDKLSFLAEWFDYEASFHKKFLLNYYPCDESIELFDRELSRIFLKRSKMEGVSLDDMFVGNKVFIYGRQIKITDYADSRTQNKIGKKKEHTFAMLKPSVIKNLGDVITQIEDRQFQITKLRMCNLTRKEALDFYESRKGDSFLAFVLEHVVSGPIVALELVGDNAIERWLENIGPTDPLEARKTAPNSLRALYGEELASNGFHGSSSYEEAIKEASFFFPERIGKSPPEPRLILENTTCCIVKPHAIRERKLGYIISYIMENQFEIICMQMFYLNNANTDEFLEIYKDVVSDYHALQLSFLDGPCVVMCIGGKNKDMNVHQQFRTFVGPEPDIGRQIRPATVRARFGCNTYQNAVHCTDLPEDTVLELEYFFKILKQ